MDDFYKVIEEGSDYQVRLTVSTFRDVEYLHIRKYYLDFEGDWLPTKEGYKFSMDIAVVQNLFEGLVFLLSKAESKSILNDYFSDAIKEICSK